MKKMDLHMHTTYSDDGEFSVSELIVKVKHARVDVFAIADHNTTEGVIDYVSNHHESELTLISAIEIDCKVDNTHLHILGYGVDPFYRKFKSLKDFYHKQEVENSAILLKKVRDLGIIVDSKRCESLMINGVLTGEMIAEIALNDQRNLNHSLLKPFRKGQPRSDNPFVNFYWDLCSVGKPAYVKMNYITLKEAVDLIKDAGGVAILAHPGNNIHEDERILKSIINHGVIGIETYSSYHNQKQVAFYQSMATKYGLIQTVGSDFHGKTKPSIKIGDHIPDEGFKFLYEALIKAISKEQS
jgi:predicted metal-dependent phosphoesterase TrpH